MRLFDLIMWVRYVHSPTIDYMVKATESIQVDSTSSLKIATPVTHWGHRVSNCSRKRIHTWPPASTLQEWLWKSVRNALCEAAYTKLQYQEKQISNSSHESRQSSWQIRYKLRRASKVAATSKNTLCNLNRNQSITSTHMPAVLALDPYILKPKKKI